MSGTGSSCACALSVSVEAHPLSLSLFLSLALFLSRSLSLSHSLWSSDALEVTSTGTERPGPVQKKVATGASSGDTLYVSPTIIRGNRIIWANAVDRDWHTTVTSVVVAEEEGMVNLQYSLRVEDIQDRVELTPYSAHTLKLGSLQVPTAKSSFNCHQARLLVEYAGKLHPSGKCVEVVQYVHEATACGGDSDDEHIPDPAIPPAFSYRELGVLSTIRDSLEPSYRQKW